MNRLTSFALTLTLCLLSVGASTQADDDDGFVRIFNGKDMTGWRGNTDFWSVQDGALTATTTEDNLLTYNTFAIWEGDAPSDFILRFQYKIVGGNSGVQYRSKVIDEEKFVVSGYQADIDSGVRHSGMLYEEKARGIIAKRGQTVTVTDDGSKKGAMEVIDFADAAALQESVIKTEEWNDYLVIVRGNHLQHFINGVMMSETIDETEQGAKTGIIAFQAHQGPPMVVQFKDVGLKELK